MGVVTFLQLGDGEISLYIAYFEDTLTFCFTGLSNQTSTGSAYITTSSVYLEHREK